MSSTSYDLKLKKLLSFKSFVLNIISMLEGLESSPKVLEKLKKMNMLKNFMNEQEKNRSGNEKTIEKMILLLESIKQKDKKENQNKALSLSSKPSSSSSSNSASHRIQSVSRDQSDKKYNNERKDHASGRDRAKNDKKKSSRDDSFRSNVDVKRNNVDHKSQSQGSKVINIDDSKKKDDSINYRKKDNVNRNMEGSSNLIKSVGHYKNSRENDHGYKKNRESSNNLSLAHSLGHSDKSDQSVLIREYNDSKSDKNTIKAEVSTNYKRALKIEQKDRGYQKNEAVLDRLNSSKMQSVKDEKAPSKFEFQNSIGCSSNTVHEIIDLDGAADHPDKSKKAHETSSKKIQQSLLIDHDGPSISEKSRLEIARNKLKLKPKLKESSLNDSVNKSSDVQRNRLAELLRTNIPTSISANSSKSDHKILSLSLMNAEASKLKFDPNCETSDKEVDSKFINSREKLKLFMKGNNSRQRNHSTSECKPNDSFIREQNKDIPRPKLNECELIDAMSRNDSKKLSSNKIGIESNIDNSNYKYDFPRSSTSRGCSPISLKDELVTETKCESVSADFSVDDTPDSPEPVDFNTNFNLVKTIPMEKVKINLNESLPHAKDGSNLKSSFHQSSSIISCSSESSSVNNQFNVNSHSSYRKNIPMNNPLNKPPILEIDLEQYKSNAVIPVPSLPLSGDLSKEIDADLQRAVEPENLETNSPLDDSNLKSTNNTKTSRSSNCVSLSDYFTRKKLAANRNTPETSSRFNPPIADVHFNRSRLPDQPHNRQQVIQPERNIEASRNPRNHGAPPYNYLSPYQPPNNFGNPYLQKPKSNMYATPPRIPPPNNTGFGSRHFNESLHWQNQSGIRPNFAPVNQFNQVRQQSLPMYPSPEFNLQRPSSPTPPPVNLHQPNRNFTKKIFTSVLLRGVPPFTTSRHIYKFFQDYLLCDMDIPLTNNLEVKGEAYVTFPDSNTAQAAVNELNGYLMNGYQITLSDFSTGFLRSAKAENEFRTAERNKLLRLPNLTRGVCNPYYDPKRIEQKKFLKKRMQSAKQVQLPIPESPVSPDTPEIITDEVNPPKIISPVKIIEKNSDSSTVKSSEIDKKNRRFRKNVVISDSESGDDEKGDNRNIYFDKTTNEEDRIKTDENSHVGDRPIASPDNQFSFPDANIEKLPEADNDSEREVDDNEPEFEDAFDDSSGSEDNSDLHHPDETQQEPLESVKDQSVSTSLNSALLDGKSKSTKSIKSSKSKSLNKDKVKIPAKKKRKASDKSSSFVTKMTRHNLEVVDTVCPDAAKLKVIIPSPKKLIISLHDEKYLNMKTRRSSSRNTSDISFVKSVNDSTLNADISNQNNYEDDSDTELTIDLDASHQNQSIHDEIDLTRGEASLNDNQSSQSTNTINFQSPDIPVSLSNSTSKSNTIINDDYSSSTSKKSRSESPIEMVAPDSTIRDDDLILSDCMSTGINSSTNNNEHQKDLFVDSSQGSCDEIEIISSKKPAPSNSQCSYEQSSEITASNSHISIDLESFKSDGASTLPLSKYKNPIEPIAIDDSSSDEIDSNPKQNLESSLPAPKLPEESSANEVEDCLNSDNRKSETNFQNAIPIDKPVFSKSDSVAACGKSSLNIMSNEVDLTGPEDIFSSPNIANDDDVSDISNLIPSLDDHNSPDIDMSTTKSLLRFIEGNQEVDFEEDNMDASIADNILSDADVNFGDIDDNNADNISLNKNTKDKISQESSKVNSKENQQHEEKDIQPEEKDIQHEEKDIQQEGTDNQQEGKDIQPEVESKNMSSSDVQSSTHRNNESDDELESLGFASISSFADNLSILSADSRDIQTPDLTVHKGKKTKVTSRRKECTRVTRGSILEKELVKDTVDWDDGGVIDLYQCELCPFVGRSHVDHVVNNHSEKVVSCIFKRDDLLTAYRDKVGPQAPVEGAHQINLDWIPYSSKFEKPMVCKEQDCGYVSDLRFDLVYHYLEHYPKALNSIYHCRLCNHITNDFIVSYDHFTSHTGEYRHECNKCGYRSFSINKIEQHNMSMHNDGPSSFNSNSLVLEDKWPYIHVCKVCSYVQIQFSQVEAHNIATHGGKAEVVKMDMFRNIVVHAEKYKAIANKIKKTRKIKKSKKVQHFEQKVFLGNDEQTDEKEELEAKLLVDRISLNIYTTRTAGIIKEQMKHLEELNNKLLSTIGEESSNSADNAPDMPKDDSETTLSADEEMKSFSDEIDSNSVNTKEKEGNLGDELQTSVSVNSKMSDSVTTDPLPLDEFPTVESSSDSQLVINESAESEESSSEYSTDEYENIDLEERPESSSTSNELSLIISRLKEKILGSSQYNPVKIPKKKKKRKEVSSIEVVDHERDEATSQKASGGTDSTIEENQTEAFQLSCLQSSCDFTCATNEELTRHEMTVHGPFKCSFYFCTFITSQEKLFEQHYQAHPQASKYGCGYGCSATVTSVRDIIDHYKSGSCSAVSHDTSMELRIESIMDPKAAAKIFGEGDNSAFQSTKSAFPTPNSKGPASFIGSSKSSIDPLKTSSPKKRTEATVVIKKEPGLDTEDISDVLPPGFNQLPRDPPTVPILFIFQQYQTDAAFKLFTGKKAADVFKCMFRGCLFTTNSLEEFKLHGTAHDDQFRCCYCMLHFTNNDSLTEHVLEEHSHCSFMCKHCLYRSTSTVYLGSHMKKFHPKDPPRYVKVTTINKHPPSNPPVDKFIHAYRCGFDGCQKRTVEAELFKSHVIASHGADSLLHCFLCSHPAKVFDLVEHMRSHMMDEFQCPYCLYGESLRENLTHHLVNCHPGRSGKVLLRKQEQSVVKQPASKNIQTDDEANSHSEKEDANKEKMASIDNSLPSTELTDSISKSIDTSLQDDVSVVNDTGPLPGSFLYQCGNQNCDFSVTNLVGLKEHMQICDNARDTQTLLCKHCSRQFRIVGAFLDHIKLHGPKRYACGVENCSFKVSVQQNYRNHCRYVHGTTSFRCELKDPKVKDPELQLYILFPKDYSIGTDSKEAITKKKRYEYHFEDIGTIPLASVSINPLKCFHCKYNTKVRFNLVKHLKLHKNLAEKTIDEIRIKEVPNAQPVNPVPCLQNKEMMFDKMSCLAGSSYEDRKRVELDLRMKNPIPKEEYDNLPCYVPDSSVNVCGVSDCQYTSINDVMLKHHIRALHSEVLSFPCKHCKNVMLTVEKLSSHFKLHGERLYRCGWCTMLSPKRHIIERHVKEKHPSKTPFEFVIREPDEAKKEGTDKESESSQKVDSSSYEDFGASTSEQANNDGEPAKWLCGLCEFKGQTQSVIVLHMKNMHDVRCQYRCGHCKYSSNVMSDIENHRKRHPKADYKVLCNYYRIDDSAIVPFNKESERTNEPLWTRDKKNKIRHIRGILLDESSRRHKMKTQKSFDMKHPLAHSDEGIIDHDEVESVPSKRRKVSVDSQPDADENKLEKTKEKSDAESLKCTYCGIVCRTNSGLASHIRANHIGRFKCKHCSFAVESSSLVISHSKSKHPNLEVSVLDTNEGNSSLSHYSDSEVETLKFLSPQKKSSDNRKTYSCEICPFQTKYSKCFQKHTDQHINNSAPYYCTVCYTRFEDLRHIRSHCTVMHPASDQNLIIKLENDRKSDKIESQVGAETYVHKKEVPPIIDDDFDELPDINLITNDIDDIPPATIKTEPVNKIAKKSTKQGVKRNSNAGPLSRKVKKPKLVPNVSHEETGDESKPIKSPKEETIKKESSANDSDHLSLEKQADNPSISYTCCHCNEKADRAAILIHMRSSHSDMPFLVRKQHGSSMWIQIYNYICDYCSYPCKSLLESMNHYISNHPIMTLSFSTVLSTSTFLGGNSQGPVKKTEQLPCKEAPEVADIPPENEDQRSNSPSLKRDTSCIDEDIDISVTSQSKKMRMDDFISDVDLTLPYCESSSDLDSTLNDENSHTKKFRCSSCRKSAKTRQEIVDHQELKHKGAAWCSVIELNSSISGGSGRTRRLVKCSVCSFVGLGEAVQLHCTTAHPQMDATSLPLLKDDKAIHRCNHCPYSNIRVKFMNQHLERSHPEASLTDYGRYVVKVENFPCSLCKEVFKSSDSLETHQKSQHKSQNLTEEENNPNISHHHDLYDGSRILPVSKGFKATARKSSSPLKFHGGKITKRSVAMKSSRKRRHRDLYSLFDTSDHSSNDGDSEINLSSITASIDFTGTGPVLLGYNEIKALCNIDPVVVLSDVKYVLNP